MTGLRAALTVNNPARHEILPRGALAASDYKSIVNESSTALAANDTVRVVSDLSVTWSVDGSLCKSSNLVLGRCRRFVVSIGRRCCTPHIDVPCVQYCFAEVIQFP